MDRKSGLWKSVRSKQNYNRNQLMELQTDLSLRAITIEHYRFLNPIIGVQQTYVFLYNKKRTVSLAGILNFNRWNTSEELMFPPYVTSLGNNVVGLLLKSSSDKNSRKVVHIAAERINVLPDSALTNVSVYTHRCTN